VYSLRALAIVLTSLSLKTLSVLLPSDRIYAILLSTKPDVLLFHLMGGLAPPAAPSASGASGPTSKIAGAATGAATAA
jgi:hypothetical protein